MAQHSCKLCSPRGAAQVFHGGPCPLGGLTEAQLADLRQLTEDMAAVHSAPLDTHEEFFVQVPVVILEAESSTVGDLGPGPL